MSRFWCYQRKGDDQAHFGPVEAPDMRLACKKIAEATDMTDMWGEPEFRGRLWEIPTRDAYVIAPSMSGRGHFFVRGAWEYDIVSVWDGYHQIRGVQQYTVKLQCGCSLRGVGADFLWKLYEAGTPWMYCHECHHKEVRYCSRESCICHIPRFFRPALSY